MLKLPQNLLPQWQIKAKSKKKNKKSKKVKRCFRLFGWQIRQSLKSKLDGQ
jgi:hypothetical protein